MRYAISDIHGCANTFRRALDLIDLQPEDELFLLGDYIDRGPDSLGVLQTIWQLEADGQRVKCLMGNHEEMYIDRSEYSEYQRALPESERAVATEWMQQLDSYAFTPGYLLVHAGLNFRAADPLADQHAMRWERYWYGDIDLNWLGERIVVHGHTPETQSNVHFGVLHMTATQRVGIDSGCSRAMPGMGYLTVLNLDTHEPTYVRNMEKS